MSDSEAGLTASTPNKESGMIMDLLTLFGVGAALTAAQRCGLLELVLAGEHSAVECAQKLGLNPRVTRSVLDVLVALGALDKRNELFGPRAVGGPTEEAILTTLNLVQSVFAHTERVLRTGEPIPELDASTTAQREATYTPVVGELGKLYARLGDYLATQVSPEPEHILDVGCGSGVWSLAIASRHRRARVTGLDFPRVLEAFKALAEQRRLSDRIDTLGGNMYEVDLPAERYDLALIANVLRLEPAPRAKELVARIARAVRPGGKLLVIDSLSGGTPGRELARAAYALHLALRTESGTVHSPAAIREWMQAAGINEIQEIDCGSQITAVGAIIGTRAGTRA